MSFLSCHSTPSDRNGPFPFASSLPMLIAVTSHAFQPPTSSMRTRGPFNPYPSNPSLVQDVLCRISVAQCSIDDSCLRPTEIPDAGSSNICNITTIPLLKLFLVKHLAAFLIFYRSVTVTTISSLDLRITEGRKFIGYCLNEKNIFESGWKQDGSCSTMNTQ